MRMGFISEVNEPQDELPLVVEFGSNNGEMISMVELFAVLDRKDQEIRSERVRAEIEFKSLHESWKRLVGEMCSDDDATAFESAALHSDAGTRGARHRRRPWMS